MSNPPPKVSLKPGEAKEWKCLVGKSIPNMTEGGIHKLYWNVGDQRSDAVLLAVYSVQPTAGTKPAQTTKPSDR